MRPKGATYTIVENAGYEGERDVLKGHKDAESAWRYVQRLYALDEIESLHVQVRRDCGGEQTYDY